MIHNAVIDAMLQRKSIRHYTDQVPSDEVIETIVRAGQQAPFASQMYSVLLTRKREKSPFRAPLLFTICVDSHKLEVIMKRQGWEMASNDLTVLMFGIQDAAYMAQNMVIAAESLGLGSCFFGQTPWRAEKVRKDYKLPKRVFPLVQLAMGYPREDPPPRPRYPMDFVLFEDKYPEFTEEQVSEAMSVMDEGYMGQNYYRANNLKLPLENGRKDTFTFDDYGWCEHISRKWGQWHKSPKNLLEQFEKCGFRIVEI
ncbi:hypothetical protein AMJ86_02465 [bacterium SM23_57]|nr:MAG: hypothetical protein AMJ86_02465 [bacterium SM23_57]